MQALHDDLGGLLVGAVMDIGWSYSQPGLPDAVRENLTRAQGPLKAAIDLKRELIENLRPTLLDNVSLFSTLNWHMKARCEAAGAAYKMSVPALEEALSPEVRTAVFRIFQEALRDILSTYNGAELSLKAHVLEKTLRCQLTHQTSAPAKDPLEHPSPETSMHHRAKRVNGVLTWKKSGNGGHMHLEVSLATSPG